MLKTRKMCELNVLVNAAMDNLGLRVKDFDKTQTPARKYNIFFQNCQGLKNS